MLSLTKTLIAKGALLGGLLVFVGAMGMAVAQERVEFPENIDDGTGPTRSERGNIVVKGVDAYTRGIYCDFAVAAHQDFQKLMEVNGDLKYPVIILLKSAPGNRVLGSAVRPEVIVPAYSPNINVTLCESFRFVDLREALMRFFLMDYSLRNRFDAGEVVQERGDSLIPPWLWDGVSEAVGFRMEGEPSELFSAVFESGRMMSVDQILLADPDQMDSLSRAVYRASAGGLVMTLLQQDGGPARMRKFIDALATGPQDQEALVQKFFPGVSNSDNSLEKWWALQVATLAKPTSLDVFSIAETEEQLQRALVVAVIENRRAGEEQLAGEPVKRSKPRLRLFKRDGEQPEAEATVAGGNSQAPIEQQRVTYDLSEYSNFAGREDLASVLHSNELRLVQLSYRSFPLHRPLIKEYLQLIGALKKGETKGIESRFAALAETRAGLLRSGKMAEDVMNLHSVTASERPSGAFEDYYRLFDQLSRARPERSDDISKYLDRIQAEYK